MTTDEDLEQLRAAYEQLHQRIEAYDETHNELQRLRDAIARVEALCELRGGEQLAVEEVRRALQLRRPS